MAQLKSRHELEAGYYATAEALFREPASVSVFNRQNFARPRNLGRGDLRRLRRRCAALEIRPPRQFAWLNDFGLPESSDNTSSTPSGKTRDAARIRSGVAEDSGAVRKLKASPADEEAKIAAQVAEVSQKKAADEKRRATEKRLAGRQRWSRSAVAGATNSKRGCLLGKSTAAV